MKIEYDYSYLYQRIEEKYHQNTFNKNLYMFIKEIRCMTAQRFIAITQKQCACFSQIEIDKISKALELSPEELVKVFFTKKEN